MFLMSRDTGLGRPAAPPAITGRRRVAPPVTTPRAGGRTRLLQVTHGLGLGGLEQVIINLCHALDRDRYEIGVLCLRHTGPFAEKVRALGIPVFALERRPGRADHLAFLKARRVMKEWRPDVVHTHNTEALVTGGLAAALAGVPTIVHTDHARDFPDKVRYMVAEWCMSHLVHRVVGVSEHTSRNLIRYEKISPRKVVTITNGISAGALAAGIDRRAKRRELGLSDEQAPVLGFGGRFTEQKGLTYLLSAMPAILARHPGAVLLLAGEGELEGPLRKQAAALGIGDHVRFAGMRTDMAEVLQLFDVLVLPSLWEGLPIILLEAMALRIPIVATAVGGVPAAIANGVTGTLVEPRSPEALANAVHDVLSGRRRAAHMTAAAHVRFQESYSARAMAAAYEALYSRSPLRAAPTAP